MDYFVALLLVMTKCLPRHCWRYIFLTLFCLGKQFGNVEAVVAYAFNLLDKIHVKKFRLYVASFFKTLSCKFLEFILKCIDGIFKLCRKLKFFL